MSQSTEGTCPRCGEILKSEHWEGYSNYWCVPCSYKQRVDAPQGETPAQPELMGRDTDWGAYESDQAARNLRSFHALKVQGRDVLAVAAKECALWNRLYREATWESAREAVSSRSASISPAQAWRIAEKFVPNCFVKDCSYPSCWGCDDLIRTCAEVERKRVAAMILEELGTPALDEEKITKALAELKEILPNSEYPRIEYEAHELWSGSPTEKISSCTVTLSVFISGDYKRFTGATLDEALQTVKDYVENKE
jgi:hypothetical protein